MSALLSLSKPTRWYALSFLLGVISALWTPPIYGWFCLFAGVGGLYWQLTHSQHQYSAFRTGWFWGLGYFLTLLSWMVMPLWQFKEQFGWLIPFEIIFIHGGLALLIAFACIAYDKLKRVNPLVNLILFVLCLTGAEWLRGHLFTGFPWSLFGYVWAASDASLQIASVISIYPLTALTLLLSVLPVLSMQRAGIIIRLVVSVSVVMIVSVWGQQRLSDAEPHRAEHPVIRVIQANIPQSIKWDPAHMAQSLKRHVELTVSEEFESIDIFVWPESAFPYQFEEDAPWASELSKILKPHQWLVTGAVRKVGNGSDVQLYNSIIMINSKGEMQSYDKHHLVPFGEYVPLRDILPLEKVTVGELDFSSGPVPSSFSLQGAPLILPLICYEVIFDRYAAQADIHGWMLNVTNDGWFGHSFQPYQHLDMSRFRAVENRVPMVRAANTGISAVINDKGQVIDSIGYDQQGIIDVVLPISDSNVP